MPLRPRSRPRLAIRGVPGALLTLLVLGLGSSALLQAGARWQLTPEVPRGITLPAPTRTPEVPHAEHAGFPRVVDGDTLEISGVRYRLHGLDAPESGQSCVRDGHMALIGAEASAALRALIGQQPVQCAGYSRDPYGRWVGSCWIGSVDLGAAMVASGHALAYRRFSDRYVPQEAEARRSRRGLWGCASLPSPEAFRRSS
jgi:endonuclease YncB( thermonuclease family)